MLKRVGHVLVAGLFFFAACSGKDKSAAGKPPKEDTTNVQQGWAKGVQHIHFCADPRDEELAACFAVTEPSEVATLLEALGASNSTMGALGGYHTQAKAQNRIVFSRDDGSTFAGDFIDPTLRLKMGGPSKEYEISDGATRLVRGYLDKARALNQPNE